MGNTDKKKVTLDFIGERYRANKNLGNALRYRNEALEYWEDGMIGDDSLLAILKEIRD